MKFRQVIAGAAVVAVVALGSFAGYRLATNKDLRARIAGYIDGFVKDSKEHLDDMSEDVVLRKAQVTRNPKVNQEWVDRQWDAVR